MSAELQLHPVIKGQADWLLGVPSSESLTLADPVEIPAWQVPFYNVALEGLRRINGLAEGQELEPALQPDVVAGAGLYQELAWQRQELTMLRGLEAYTADLKSGVLESPLRGYQRVILDCVGWDALNTDRYDHITIKSPTGSGKTIVSVALAEGLKYHEDPKNPIRLLILTPTKEVCSQTIEAFDRFSELKVRKYSGQDREIDEVTVMMYQSFLPALARGDITDTSFSAIVRDEGDTFQGQKIGTEIDEYATRANKLVILATATPLEKHRLAYESTIVEGIGEGRLAPLSVRERAIPVRVSSSIERIHYGDGGLFLEIEEIIHNEQINGAIVEEVLDGLAKGLKVYVRCLPGNKTSHAEIIQDMLLAHESVPIKHPYAGDMKRRKIMAIAITGSMPEGVRTMAIDTYNNPTGTYLDVLTSVDALSRGFNSPILGKVINVNPAGERVVEQVCGRAARLFHTQQGMVVAKEVVDFTYPNRTQVTSLDIINRDAPDGMVYVPGAIIGPDLADLRFPDALPGSAFQPIPAEQLQEAVTVLLSHNFSEVDGYDLRQVEPGTIRGHGATQTMAVYYAFLESVIVGMTTKKHTSMEDLASSLQLSAAELILTAQRLRVRMRRLATAPNMLDSCFYNASGTKRIREFIIRQREFDRLSQQ